MSRKYDRLAPDQVTDLAPGMRLYGRNQHGRFIILVVHEVTSDQVYYTVRMRGVRGADHHGWFLRRSDLDEWTTRRSRCLAVRVRRPETQAS